MIIVEVKNEILGKIVSSGQVTKTIYQKSGIL